MVSGICQQHFPSPCNQRTHDGGKVPPPGGILTWVMNIEVATGNRTATCQFCDNPYALGVWCEVPICPPSVQLRGISLEETEREWLDSAIVGIHTIPARNQITRAGQKPTHCSLLLEGIISSHIDDRQGLRQVAALHFPGEFIDLDAFYLHSLDYALSTVTAATLAIIPHAALDAAMTSHPALARKFGSAKIADAALLRGWLFRLGRLDALGRIAHFLSETNVRLMAAGLSDGRRFALGITQSDLAEICGLTNIHVNRVMRQLREEKLCVFRSSIVDIIDPAKLAARGQFKSSFGSLSPGKPCLALVPKDEGSLSAAGKVRQCEHLTVSGQSA